MRRMRVPVVVSSIVFALVVAGGVGSPAAAAPCGLPTPACAPEPEPEPQPEPQPEPAPAPAPKPAPAPQPAPAPAPAAKPPVGDDAASARELFEAVNRTRAERGLGVLAAHADAATIATDHSRAMAARHDIFHNDELFSAETKRRLGAVTLGENVALNDTAAGAHQRLMASDPHRANIESPRFTALAVGAVRGDDGRLYVTEVFVEQRRSAPAPSTSTTAAPAAPAKTSVVPKAAAAPSTTTPKAPKAPKAPTAAKAAAATPPTGAPSPSTTTAPDATTTTVASEDDGVIELASAEQLVAVPPTIPGAGFPPLVPVVLATLALLGVAVAALTARRNDRIGRR